jgi:hypothetical protein
LSIIKATRNVHKKYQSGSQYCKKKIHFAGNIKAIAIILELEKLLPVMEQVYQMSVRHEILGESVPFVPYFSKKTGKLCPVVNKINNKLTNNKVPIQTRESKFISFEKLYEKCGFYGQTLNINISKSLKKNYDEEATFIDFGGALLLCIHGIAGAGNNGNDDR